VFSVTAAAATNTTVSLNHAYPKGNENYGVVVKDAPGTKLALYVNDKNPVYATTNKTGWATFRLVKLANNEKISFAIVYGSNQSNQKPVNYVRYAMIRSGNISFVKTTSTDKVSPAPAVSATSSLNTSITPVPVATPAPSASATTITSPAVTSCTPLTDGGNCYRAGEYCRDSDHGDSGVADNGESITCADNDGWRWEPN
jgi:hypothetical protein